MYCYVRKVQRGRRTFIPMTQEVSDCKRLRIPQKKAGQGHTYKQLSGKAIGGATAVRNSVEGPHNIKRSTVIGPASPLLGVCTKEWNQDLKDTLPPPPHAHHRTSHSSQDMGQPECPWARGNVQRRKSLSLSHTHTRIVFSCKILPFAIT